MATNSKPVVTRAEKPAWYQETKRYARPDLRIALRQLSTTLIPYLLILALMIYTVLRGYPYPLTLVLSLPAAALFVRIFIFFHDCTHGSFLPSPGLNRNVGYLCGILTFTPFHDWRRSHAEHHITAGDLDRRGIGDILTRTVSEYETCPPLQRLAYRLYRHPMVMFGIGPLYYFLLRNRYPSKIARKLEYISVIATNIAIAVIFITASLTIGFRTYILVQLPVLLLAATVGIWLFYIQHQFQGVYWARHNEWDPIQVALKGASYYQLPKLLQWITGNIGFHHIHHARPGIPNYHLQQCHEEIPVFAEVRPLTARESLKSLRFNLYDEEKREMVSFKEALLRKGPERESSD